MVKVMETEPRNKAVEISDDDLTEMMLWYAAYGAFISRFAGERKYAMMERARGVMDKLMGRAERV